MSMKPTTSKLVENFMALASSVWCNWKKTQPLASPQRGKKLEHASSNVLDFGVPPKEQVSVLPILEHLQDSVHSRCLEDTENQSELGSLQLASAPKDA